MKCFQLIFFIIKLVSESWLNKECAGLNREKISQFELLKNKITVNNPPYRVTVFAAELRHDYQMFSLYIMMTS